ncbi:cytochrome P450 [Amylocarpus encephaloides]|uniref:Cytochrome P450 n=1 Tax=Amylocarpus encephaloides TaxID=45428 RepID=A0A9P7YUC2_9HELO|nr:cytochrome P450 [Amylocarpus encephaloides]
MESTFTESGLSRLGLTWTYTLFLFLVPASIYGLDRLFSLTPDAREPPLVKPTIPIIGHLIGIIRHQSQYYTKIWNKYQLPITTLPILGGRLYIVNTPDLIATVQKQHKALSFHILSITSTINLGIMSDQASEALWANSGGDENENSLLRDGMATIHAGLKTGAAKMNLVAAETVLKSLDELDERGEVEIDLWKWAENCISLGATNALYGPENPHKDPAVAKGMMHYITNANPLLLGFLPRILSPKACNGLDVVVQAFKQYYGSDDYTKGSDLTQGRQRILTSYNLSLEDLARFETLMGLAGLVNSVPTSLWALYHVFSDPALLARVRTIVEAQTVSSDSGRKKTINLGRLAEDPYLRGVIYEALRFHSHGAGARAVVEDTLINDKFLVKKGTNLLMPYHSLHFHSETWGPTVDDFDPGRFMPDAKHKLSSTAFRGFGGGTNMCPAKNFATMEILGMVTMMVSRFDLVPREGRWVDPRDASPNMIGVITSPKDSVMVKVVRRKEVEDLEWCFAVAKE